MNREPVRTSLQSARRLAVTKQRLSGKLPTTGTEEGILSVIRDTAYIQWDPVTIVAPSHLLSLWARTGGFGPDVLDRLLWTEKKLLLSWTPMANLLLTEDYPLYFALMRRYPGSMSKSWGSQRTRAEQFLRDHGDLRRKILRTLEKGPRTVSEFDDHTRTKRADGDYNPTSDVSLMLYHLLMSGKVMVVGHQGAKNLWGLTARFLPEWVEKGNLSQGDFEELAARRALRALGTADPKEINLHFVRGRYHDLRGALARLAEQSEIRRVIVEGLGPRDERYILEEDVPLLESMGGPTWEPRMSLLPPFDNMVHSQDRTLRLFDFNYVREQFLPKEKRRFGTYVLPILWGDRLIGRIDLRMDKDRNELVVNAVFAEPGAPQSREVGAEVAATISRWAGFLGADRVKYSSRVPAAWRSSLR